jgi:hypothetical protein
MSIRKLEEGEKTVTHRLKDTLLKKGVHKRTCNRLIVSSIGIAKAIRVIEEKAFGPDDSNAHVLGILKKVLHKSEMSHMAEYSGEAMKNTYESACKALEEN